MCFASLISITLHRRTDAANSPEHYCSLLSVLLLLSRLVLRLPSSVALSLSLPPSPPSLLVPPHARRVLCASYVLDAGASPLEFSQRAWHIKNLRPSGLAASLA